MSKYVIDTTLDNVKKVIAMGVTKGGAIWTDTTDIENLEELNSDYINEHFGDLQDTAYQRGLEDAWEAAKKIALMDTETSENVTGYFGLFRIMENLTPMQAIEKLKAYEEKKADDKIEVGDVVRLCRHKVPYIVTSCDGDDDTYILMTVNGGFIKAEKYNVRKIGRHFDIASILEDMKA